ncbi:MAG: YggS family pyridoxal phosphate-dependent enzyme [Oscillospiraceae bacterium]|nr:YggS family pyridoxal phosphate-dependent enzyme [Oscillospiraceae bacterium]
MQLNERICAVQERIARAARRVGRDPGEITLCAATKTQSDETIRGAIAAGLQVCGENRVQELCAHLEADAYAGAGQVHFIGHLQTNKVNKVVGRVELIHSVDSLHLLQAVEKQAEKLGIVQDILLQVNIGGEESKGGVEPEALEELVNAACATEHVRLRGLMAIPPIAHEPGANTHYFVKMHQLFVDMRDKMPHNKCDMDCLSMGMSGDFEDAIAHGATLVRVGTALFGPRPAPV